MSVANSATADPGDPPRARRAVAEKGIMSSRLLRSKAGDIITEYDGRKVERVSDLPRTVAGTSVGRDVRFA